MANQGIYHPTYNPNGSKKLSDGNFWYNTTIPISSTMDCFDPAKLLTASGYIGTTSGRPDGLFYDQIHESDILDLRNSSKKPEDYNRLINREFNKLVAGTTRGSEGEYYTINSQIKTPSSYEYSTGGYSRFNFPVGTFSKSLGGSYASTSGNLGILNVSGKNYIINAIRINEAGYDRVYLNINYGNLSGLWSGDAIITIKLQTTRTKSNTLLHCDIIGNPANYPTAWKESGVSGTPLIVAENGTSLLPNGTLDTFKLSRKANTTPLLCLRSTDSGATWTSFTPTFSTTTNAITLTDEPAANLVMVYYQTHTSMAVPVVNSEVLAVGDVNSKSDYTPSWGSHLVSSIIGKVPTATTNPTTVGSKLNYVTPNLASFSTSSTYSPTHSSVIPVNTTSPTVKVFPYLTRLNGKAYLNLVFKEMKYNGTSWGDDSKFNIVDNVSTTLDDNGQAVLIGQKTVELPYFIDAGE